MNKNERKAIFVIKEGVKGYDITNRQYNVYNRYEVPKDQLFVSMTEMSDIFNNVLEIAITFEVVN